MVRVIVQSIIAFFILLIIPFISFAQNPPNVQQASLRAPANLKIDGKATEWGKFQAYNHATDIYYTICNDNSNLYLIIHANDPDVLTKITNCGVVFSVNPSGEKSDNSAMSITYPIFDLRYGNKPFITFSNTGGLLRSQREAIDANPDSMVAVANKKLHDNEKYIRTSGIGQIDTLLSVYNTDGVKARESFDSSMAYTYELAMPLNLFGLDVNNHKKFVYHIRLPGISIDKDFGLKATKGEDGVLRISAATGVAVPKKDHLQAVTSTTDFWGEYSLAR